MSFLDGGSEVAAGVFALGAVATAWQVTAHIEQVVIGVTLSATALRLMSAGMLGGNVRAQTPSLVRVVFVDAEAVESKAALDKWVKLSLGFVKSMPAKKVAPKKTATKRAKPKAKTAGPAGTKK